MIDDPFWLLSFIFSAFFSFFFAALIIQGALLLFRVQNPRIRSLLRIVPIVDLMVDPFLRSFSIGHILNPLNCTSCLQKFFLSFFPALKTHLTLHQIAFTKYLAATYPSFPFLTLLLTFATITTWVLLRDLSRMKTVAAWLKARIREGKICPRAITNPKLQAQLHQQKATLFISDAIQIPMATYGQTILMPRHFVEQSPQDEFEAVLAHELEHLRWKDPLVKSFSQMVQSLFWWVPMRWWLKKLEADQELAADSSIQRYGLEHKALASALFKVTKSQCSSLMTGLCGLFSGKPCAMLVRMQMILDPTQPFVKYVPWQEITGTAAGSLFFLSCMM